MTISGIALFLLLAQTATPQPQTAPAAPASIEGVVAKAVTGESLSKVIVTLTEFRSSPPITSQLLLPGISPNSAEYVQIQAAMLNQISNTSGSSAVTVTTASDGRFLFENLKPGTYSLKATLGGYAPAEYGQRGPNSRGMTITLKPGQKMQAVSLTMTPGGTITGRIVDANGDPLSRALVQAQKLVYQETGRSLVTVQAVPTDDKGEYRLFWLPPGKYFISALPSDDRMRTIAAVLPTTGNSNVSIVTLASANAFSSIWDMGTGPIAGVVPGVKVTSRTLSNGDVIDEAAVQVFYPAALEISTATPLEVRPGGLTSGIDITTRSARVYRIRGVVISSTTGQPISATSISLIQRNGTTVSQTVPVMQAPNNSGFEIAGVVPGSYYLLSTGPDGAGKAVAGILPIDIGETNIERAILTANPASAINGHISGNAVTTATNSPTYFVQLDPRTPGFPSGGRLRTMEGSFIVPILYAGDYRVTITTPPGTYPQSIRFGGQDVLRDGLHIEGPTNETLEIVVSPNAGRLEGNVTADRQKFSNATVVLVPASSLRQQTNLYQTVQSNSEGHFTFENIPPGSYKVFAWEDVEAFAWFDADFMRNVENRGTEIVMREGAKESIEITVIPR